MGEGFPVAKMQYFIPDPLFSFSVGSFTHGAFGFLRLKAWLSFSRLFKYFPSLPFPSHYTSNWKREHLSTCRLEDALSE